MWSPVRLDMRTWVILCPRPSRTVENGYVNNRAIPPWCLSRQFGQSQTSTAWKWAVKNMTSPPSPLPSVSLFNTPPHSHSHPPLCSLIFLRNMTSPGVKSSSSSRVGPQVAALAHDGSCHVSTHRQDEVILLQKLNSFMVLQLFNLLLLRLQARFNMNNKV